MSAAFAFGVVMGIAIAALVYLNNEPKGPRHP